MAYTRLLRLYYRREQPIPGDLAAACRLVRASSKDQKQAVEAVLKEFFVLVDGAWHQDRCDAEIQRFQSGEPERAAKKANEETRLKRHREERAELFQRLTQAGQHAVWNIGIKELRELVGKLPPPLTATAPATPATATQSPVPSPQSPNTSVPNGTGGAAADAEMSKDELWKAGKSLLSQSGMPAAQCGSFVGKLVKDFGELVVVEAVRVAVVERPANPVEYLKATCMRAAGQRTANEPAWRAEQRARTQQAAPGVAAGAVPATKFFAEMEATNVAPRLLG